MAKNDQTNTWQSSLQEFGRPLHKTTFVVLDLETTGGAPHLGAAITEIGAVKSRGGAVLGEYKSFVNPGHSVPNYITELTGITDEIIFESPAIGEVLPDFIEFLGAPEETVLIAQNAPFDLSFLLHAARSNGITWPTYPVLDTAIIARRVLSREEVPNCQLSTLAEFFGATTTPNHRALDDARATLDVFHGLLERLGSLEIYSLEELQNFGKRITKSKSPVSKQPNDSADS